MKFFPPKPDPNRSPAASEISRQWLTPGVAKDDADATVPVKHASWPVLDGAAPASTFRPLREAVVYRPIIGLGGFAQLKRLIGEVLCPSRKFHRQFESAADIPEIIAFDQFYIEAARHVDVHRLRPGPQFERQGEGNFPDQPTGAGQRDACFGSLPKRLHSPGCERPAPQPWHRGRAFDTISRLPRESRTRLVPAATFKRSLEISCWLFDNCRAATGRTELSVPSPNL